MGKHIDEAKVVAQINDHLRGHEFKPRDADGNDFQYGDDNSLRFKTGTCYGEVAVQVYIDNRARKEVIRIVSDHGVDEAKHEIDATIAKHIDSGFESAAEDR